MRKLMVALLVMVVAMLGSMTVFGAEKVKISLLSPVNKQFNEGQKKVIAEYERQNPNVTVELVTAPGTYSDFIMTRLAGGQLPDLVLNVHQNTSSLLEGGTFVELSDLIAKDPEMPALIKSWIPGAWEFTSHGENRYLMPNTVAIRIAFINKDLFQKAGLNYPTDDWTWDDFLTYARRITTRNSEGAVTAWGMGEIPTDEIWLMHWVYQAGGRYFDNQFMPTKSNFASEHVIEAMRFVHSLRWEYRVTPKTTDPFRGTTGFLNNAVGIYIHNPARIADFAARDGLAWDIRRLPHYREYASTATYDAVSISSQTKHLDVAWDFAKFFTKPQAQALYSTHAHVPISRQIALSSEWLNYPVAGYNKKAFFDESAVAYTRTMTEKYEQEYQRIARAEWPKAFDKNEVPVETVARSIHEQLTVLLQSK